MLAHQQQEEREVSLDLLLDVHEARHASTLDQPGQERPG